MFAVENALTKAVPVITSEDARLCFYDALYMGESLVTVADEVCNSCQAFCNCVENDKRTHAHKHLNYHFVLKLAVRQKIVLFSRKNLVDHILHALNLEGT